MYIKEINIKSMSVYGKKIVTIQNPEQKLTMVHQEQRDG